MKRIGLLGGTFDPFHFGHINLGLELQEKHALDEILLCPAAASPFKLEQQATAEHRLEMARLAAEELKGWRVTDWAVKRPGPSYMIDMVKEVHSQAEKNQEKIALFLLLGQDIVGRLGEWKDIERLLSLAPPLIGMRNGGNIHLGLPELLEKICQQGMTSTRVLEISSTLVRERLKKKLYCGHLVPAKVLDFIYHHQLYLH